MDRNIVRLLVLVIGVGAAMLAGGCSSAQGASPDEKREYVQALKRDTLADLYAAEPDAKKEIEDAAGYGVFSSIGTNVILVTTSGGYGIVHDNTTREDTYMKMAGGGVGLGIGVTDFRAVFVFQDKATLNKFIWDGWSWGADAEAAAKSGDTGGEAAAGSDFRDGIKIYQFTENGLSIGASIGGTKFSRDKELND